MNACVFPEIVERFMNYVNLFMNYFNLLLIDLISLSYLGHILVSLNFLCYDKFTYFGN